MILHSVCRKSKARKRRRRTNARTGEGSRPTGLRRRKVRVLSHRGGCTRQRCDPSGPGTSKESRSSLTALRPGCRDEHSEIFLYMESSFSNCAPMDRECMNSLSATCRRPLGHVSQHVAGISIWGIWETRHLTPGRVQAKRSSWLRIPAFRQSDIDLGGLRQSGPGSNATRCNQEKALPLSSPPVEYE